jgi:type IV pilus assembly protein PilM
VFGGTLNKRLCPIGIDVGGQHVKLMQLERTGDGYRAVAAASADLPPELPPGSDEYHRAVADAIGFARQAGGFVGKAAVSALPADAVQYKNLRLPKMPAKDLASAVRWEANDRLQLTSEPHAVQYFDAGEVRQGDEDRHEVILLAAPESFVEKHVGALVEAGLTPEAIDVVPGALARCLQLSAAATGAEVPRVMIDIGYTGSKVLICRGGRILFFKLIDIGGKHFDDAAAKHLNVPRSELTALRQQMHTDESSVQEHIRRAIHESIRPALAELGREIGLCLRYYSVTFRGRRPEQADLIGGEAGQAWLEKMLTEQAGVTIATADPLAEVDCAAVAQVLGETSPAWAVAAGLSMRPAQTKPSTAGRKEAA